MLEITTTRHNPLIDPQLAVWSWEIPVYLFLGGIVAGMMVLAGIAMLRIARGDDPRRFFSLQTPLLGFVLINLGMGALFLDLTHKLYVWRVYLTFQPASPMSWGSWVLIIVYGVLLASALIRLPDAWPWLGRARARSLAAPVRRARSRGPRGCARSRWANIVLGVGARHLHRHPAQHDGRAAAVEQRDPRAAVPVLGPVGRRGDGAPRRRVVLPRAPGAAGHDRRRARRAVCSRSARAAAASAHASTR